MALHIEGHNSECICK